MPNIKLLSPDIIAKIAAGEVIDRPASVVKELCENALDAGATKIEVTLKDGGKQLIQISDNGSGIAKEDLPLIFERHATSKINTAQDLFDIHSLGFRGEALYSIAAVSDITVNSQEPESAHAWEIHRRGKEEISFKPSSRNGQGTDIIIQELFFNTPARKKFLKATTSETHQILNHVIPYCLLHPDKQFIVKRDQKVILHASSTNSHAQRMADVLNIKKEFFIEGSAQHPDKDISIYYVLGDINAKRNRRDMQFVFINGRPVQSKTISFHMNQIYRLIFPPEQAAVFSIFINLPANEIDVNIHPSKREVKVHQEQVLCSFLRNTCEQAIMTKGSTAQSKDPFPLPKQNEDILNALSSNARREESSRHDLNGNELFEPTQDQQNTQSRAYAFPQSDRRRVDEALSPNKNVKDFIPDPSLFPSNESLHDKFKHARYIGSFKQKFLLFEEGETLLMVDQHAAQERIMYEHFYTQLEKGSVEVQNLLTPLLISLSPPEKIIWEQSQEQFESIGISATLFDEQTLAIQSQPVVLKDVEKAVHQLLGGEQINLNDHDVIARRACRSSIMAGDKLNKEQVEYQREQLLKCLDPFTCPHGRPIVIQMTEDFLDKQFLRT